MDRKQGNKALWVTINHSRWGQRVWGAMYLATAGAVLASGAPGWVKAGLLLLLVGSVLGHRAGRGGVRAARIKALGCEEDGQWWIRPAGDEPLAVCILPDTVVLPWLVLLSMRCDRGRYHRLPLLADAVDADDLRRLRVRLRAGAGRSSAVPSRAGVRGLLTRMTSRWSRREGVDGG